MVKCEICESELDDEYCSKCWSEVSTQLAELGAIHYNIERYVKKGTDKELIETIKEVMTELSSELKVLEDKITWQENQLK